MENNSIYKKTIDSSQFLTRLVKIPVINSAINVATDYYGKAKVNQGKYLASFYIFFRNICCAFERTRPLCGRHF